MDRQPTVSAAHDKGAEMSERVAKLRQLASQATNGEWVAEPRGWADGSSAIRTGPHDVNGFDHHSEENAAYIAAASPELVSALCFAWLNQPDISHEDSRFLAMTDTVRGLFHDLAAELEKAVARFASFNSPHEGKAVIEEELEELWQHVKENTGRSADARAEAIQVAAMALRYAHDLCGAAVSTGRNT